MKVITVIGTRPDIIRLSCVIKKMDEYFDHKVVNTGQNWDVNLSEIFFSEMQIRKPDYNLQIVGKNLGESMGNIISKSYELFLQIQPDAILLLGDTNSCLCAISAKRLKIPIFHMEAGNRCFDQNVPEEINRKIIDHISDINLPYTEHSRRNLIAEGFKSDHIIVTGSPLAEVYSNYNDDIEKSIVLETLLLEKRKYILWSTHREENIDIEASWLQVVNCIDGVSKKYSDMKIILSTHPRTLKKIKEKVIQFPENVIVHQPFGLFDYIKLQKNAFCVISDSGTINEESALLKIPAVNFRVCTERPEVMDKGNIIMSGLNIDHLQLAIKMATSYTSPNLPSDYIDINVSDKVVRTILSYTQLINRVTWRKS